MEENDNIEEQNIPENTTPDNSFDDAEDFRIKGLSGLYEDWFLDYASYVILERAVPDLRDGLKPVQRRIMHSMKEMDDGRYNKVANIIGNTMKYHPHGDASIRDALVQLGQKDLLIDMQGNWGNILTGDPAAAPRYIEARLSKFAKEVVFNPKTTKWLLSYDGRNKEPEVLPVKFPLLLAQGVEGIAVGLASKILPHNFNELIDAAILYLRNKDFELFPDFPTGGMADVSRYNDGLRGGRIRVRARISKEDKKTLVITEIPFSTNTSGLIESIIQANDKGKIKVKKIEDNTAENVEIKIHLGIGVSPDQTIDALYAFSQCEVSLSPNSCVIDNNKPQFLGIKQQLKNSVENTQALLRMELEIKRAELLEQWHFSNLEKIFIRERIYRDIEEAESWEQALEFIDKGLDPYKSIFKREITQEDIIRLTEIKIKRISKYNEFKADEYIKGLEDQIKEVDYYLDHLIQYTIDYFKNIKKKFGADKGRKTELRSFETIDAASVAVSNVKFYANRAEGFVGTGLKKDEFLFECSDIDDIIVFRKDGTFTIIKLADKVFVGKDIIHVGIFSKNDDRTIYNMIYRDGKVGASYAKRFAIKSITRDKVYDLTNGKPGSTVLYFTANPNGEAEIVKVKLRAKAKVRKLIFDYDFSELAIKGRGTKGNLVSKHLVSNISLKEDGVSTLGARDIWYDDTVKRLNSDERGKYLGAFGPEDKILTLLSTGEYLMTGFDLSTHFDEDMISLQKYDPEVVWTLVYFEGASSYYYVKRFQIESSDKKVSLLTNHAKSRMVHISNNKEVEIKLLFNNKGNAKMKESEVLLAEEFIDVKGYRAKGKRLTDKPVKKIELIEKAKDEELERSQEATQEEKQKEAVPAKKLEPTNNDTAVKTDLKQKETAEKKKVLEPKATEKDVQASPKSTSKAVKVKDNKEEAKSEPEKPTASKDSKVKTSEKETTKTAKKSVAASNKAEKVKPASPSKNVKNPNPDKKVSLDSDEPLQMELDF
jgi:topoisomerase-4 subunit A